MSWRGFAKTERPAEPGAAERGYPAASSGGARVIACLLSVLLGGVAQGVAQAWTKLRGRIHICECAGFLNRGLYSVALSGAPSPLGPLRPQPVATGLRPFD
jgi:hypothetical protein